MKSTAVNRVHVIFKTHLDIGFTDYARNVMNSYFTSYIPAAIDLARRMREDGGPDRFVWTTGSWLIYEYLERADPAKRRDMEAAIAAGDIAWHGLPFTTHTELIDPGLFRFGLGLSHELDRRFGRTTMAAKMTDVPGHTRSMIPFLADNGIRFLHIGVNIACRPPAVPGVFRWRHPGGASVVVMYHTGYGGTTTVPGLCEAIAFAHTGDNQGPQSAEQIRKGYADLRGQFPGACVGASTLDAYAAVLLPLADELPEVTDEIGDTWIHGAGTDPWKVAAFRELCRARNRWLSERRVAESDAGMKAFSRTLLLIPEHTWGLNEEVHLNDFVHYARPDFEAARKQDAVGEEAVPPELSYTLKFRRKAQPPKYSTFEASWEEQRGYIHDAVRNLGDTAVGDEARRLLEALRPRRDVAAGYAEMEPSSRARTTRHFKVRFDAATGAMTGLTDLRTGRNWADIRHPLGLFRYQTFSQADYDRYLGQYCINMEHSWCWEWAIPDLSKPGMAATGAESRLWLPRLTQAGVCEDEAAFRFRIQLAMPTEAVAGYGAPATVRLEYVFPHEAPRVEVEAQWFDKAANRLPEAIWLSFCPRVGDRRGWSMDKMGSQVSPLEVVRYGNRRLHAIHEGVSCRDSRGGLALGSLDAPLVAPGAPGLLDFSQAQPDTRRGMHFNLWNNIWGTNFPMWYGEDARFRFRIEAT